MIANCNPNNKHNYCYPLTIPNLFGTIVVVTQDFIMQNFPFVPITAIIGVILALYLFFNTVNAGSIKISIKIPGMEIQGAVTKDKESV